MSVGVAGTGPPAFNRGAGRAQILAEFGKNLLVLQSFHKRFGDGVVVGISLAQHADPDSVRLQQGRVLARGVLHAAIEVPAPVQAAAAPADLEAQIGGKFEMAFLVKAGSPPHAPAFRDDAGPRRVFGYHNTITAG